MTTRYRCPECRRLVGARGNGLASHYPGDNPAMWGGRHCPGTGAVVKPTTLVGELLRERFGAPRLPPPPPAPMPTYLLVLMPPEPWIPPREKPRDVTGDVWRMRGYRWSRRQIATLLDVPETAVDRVRERRATQRRAA